MDDKQVSILRKLLENVEKRLDIVEKVNILQISKFIQKYFIQLRQTKL